MKGRKPTGATVDSRANLADWRGVGDLVALATERLAAPVEGVHRAVASRWLGMGGSTVEPGRRLVDGLIASIYTTIRLGGSAAGSAISIGADLASEHMTLRPVWATPTGRYVQSILNGLWGDKLEDDQSSSRIQLGLRDGEGAPLPAEPTALSGNFPEATDRIVVMLHGLGETERCWLSDAGTNLAAMLERDGFSVLLVRYNSGRSILDNGSDLADLLETISVSWPVAIDEIALIGHSMGGLVARSAAVTAHSSGYRWLGLARHLVAIGSPHLGSPIEKGVQLVSEGLGLFAEGRALQGFLEQRSAGIKDLRFGVAGADQIGALEHHFIAGTVATESAHLFGSVMGDLVVGVGSATGSGRRRQVHASDVFVVGGLHHGGLIHDGEVHSQTRKWLASSR